VRIINTVSQYGETFFSDKLTVGCANQKFDIFKSTPKLLSCVGVEKTLEWQQILAIPSSENILKYDKIE